MASRCASATFLESAASRSSSRARTPASSSSPERTPGVGAAALDARHHHLLRGEPGGSRAAVVLEEDAEEALEAPHQRAVEDDRPVPPAGAVLEGRARSARAARGRPGSSALPRAPEPVAEHELELRPVERALSGLVAPGEARAPRAASASSASARSQTASSPRRFDGRPENATSTSSKPSAAYSARRLRTKRRSSSGT